MRERNTPSGIFGEPFECLLHRPELELEPELEGRRGGEPLIRRLHGDRPEPRERLHSDGLACLEIHDRVEHHPHAVPRHEPFDLASERLVGFPFDLLAAQLGGELRDDSAHHLGRKAGASLGDVLDPLDELVGGRALDEVPHRAGPEHLQDVLPVLVCREGDDPRPGRDTRDPAGRVGTTARRHADVDEGDVRQVRLGDPDRLLGIAGRPDQLDTVLVTEELCEGGAEAGFVVGEEHPDGFYGPGSPNIDEGSVGSHRADATGHLGVAQASG